MKHLIFFLIMGCSQQESIPLPIEPDCTCGEISTVSVIYDTDTKRTKYTYKLFNLCTGNVGYSSEVDLEPKDIGEVMCFDSQW